MNNSDIEKEKGRKLISEGFALIDASGRTKEIKERSVLGLASKKVQFAILVNASEKKKIYEKLNKKYGSRSSTIIHSVKIYYAIKDYIETCPGFYICCDGFDQGLLKHYLKMFLGYKYHEKKINIIKSLKPMFGKKNMADRLAWRVNKKGEKPSMILKEKHFELLRLL